MEHWATFLDIVAAGLEGDRVKVRVYAELLLERLGEDCLAAPHRRRWLSPSAVFGSAARMENGSIPSDLTFLIDT